MPIKTRGKAIPHALLLAVYLSAGAVHASFAQAGPSGQGGQSDQAGLESPGQSAPTAQAGQADPGARPAQRASERVSEALLVVRQLDSTPRMKQLLQNAKGVLIVPSYARAALGVGAHGGGGLLVLQREGKWSAPAFYDLGGVTVGLQAGAEGGAIALILNNDKAVKEFMQKNNFTLSAQADLTVLNWSRLAQSTAGTGDVVVWSGAKGLFGDAAAIGISDIRFNEKLTNAYYGRTLSLEDIAAGKANNPQAQPLQQALAQAVAGPR